MPNELDSEVESSESEFQPSDSSSESDNYTKVATVRTQRGASPHPGPSNAKGVCTKMCIF